MLYSDCESLKVLKGQGKLNKRLARRIEFLEQSPYVSKHKQGKAHIVTNALPRRHLLLSSPETKLYGLKFLKDPYLHNIDFAELNKNCVSSKGRQQGLYTPLPIPEPPWINISMDFEVTLPRIKNGKVLERISNNAYKINIPSDYGNVSASFNVADISLFETGNEDLDSRSNSVQEGGDDSNPPMTINLDDLMGLRGPITRARAKKAQSTLGQLVLILQTSLGPNNHMRPINSLLIEDEPFEGHG
ncbi:hypothetical protein Lal_00008673 [Lupinus albus]|nr:hypothetical protein Lal_00008673 [Lupinus albus]